MSSTPLVITGMHRSGTSLLASAMQLSGVEIGDELLGASRSNVKGHYEDVDFLAFHEGVFEDNGTNVMEAHQLRALSISDERRQQAQHLVEARRHHAVWGWKDPRTCLFLDFWESVLPSARYLFIFRDPRDVLDSLRRRGHPELFHHFHGAWPLRKLGFDTFRTRRAVQYWLSYNQAILDFATTRMDRCRVLELDQLTSQLPLVLKQAREDWGLALQDVELEQVLDETLLQSSSKPGGTSRAVPRDLEQVLRGLRELTVSP